MNLIQRLKLLWKFRGLFNTVKEKYMTKGMKSSEFWLTVITALVTGFEAFKGSIDPKWATIIGAVLTAAYTIARGLAKQGQDATPAAPAA